MVEHDAKKRWEHSAVRRSARGSSGGLAFGGELVPRLVAQAPVTLPDEPPPSASCRRPLTVTLEHSGALQRQMEHRAVESTSLGLVCSTSSDHAHPIPIPYYEQYIGVTGRAWNSIEI